MSFSKNYINVKITPKKRLFQVKGLILDEPLERVSVLDKFILINYRLFKIIRR